MPYWRLFYHIVWATHERLPLVLPAWEIRLYAYLKQQAPRWQARTYAINGMPDHIHLAISVAPSVTLSDVIARLKGGSAHFVNYEIKPESHLMWQNEYSIHSVSERALPNVIAYIRNQKQHHTEHTTIPGLEKW